MTKVRNFFLLVVTLFVGALVLQGIQGGGSSTTDKRETDTYRIKITYVAIDYVIDFKILISNKQFKPYPVKLDATGTYGEKINHDGFWTHDVIYRKGSGGIIVDLAVSGANSSEAIAHCSIWRLRNGAETIAVSGPHPATVQGDATCTYDRGNWFDRIIN